MDGQFYSIEFHPSSTAFEVMELIKKKIGLQDNSMGYAIYEVVGNTERSLLLEEKITDVMAKWEKYRNATHQGLNNTVCSFLYNKIYKLSYKMQNNWCLGYRNFIFYFFSEKIKQKHI